MIDQPLPLDHPPIPATAGLAACWFRVVDSETCGLDPRTCGVVEVAFQDVSGTGQVGERFDSLVNPGMPIPAGASAVHHIVDGDVAGAPPYEAVKPRMIPKDRPPLYVAHNAEFDRGFLKLEGEWICTHRLAKHLWPDLQGHGNEEVRYSLKLEPDYPRGVSHRATADVATTVAILLAALPLVRERWPEIQTPAELIAKIAAPCRLVYVPFRQHKGKKFTEVEASFLDWIIWKGAGGTDCVHTAKLELEDRAGGRRAL